MHHHGPMTTPEWQDSYNGVLIVGKRHPLGFRNGYAVMTPGQPGFGVHHEQYVGLLVMQRYPLNYSAAVQLPGGAVGWSIGFCTAGDGCDIELMDKHWRESLDTIRQVQQRLGAKGEALQMPELVSGTACTVNQVMEGTMRLVDALFLAEPLAPDPE